MMQDPFELNGEIKILDSGIRNVFTPHQPINALDHFWGRKDEVRKIIETLDTPGLHFLLYGERGVGKSSLGNIVINLIIEKLYKDCTFLRRCDKETTFEELFEESLKSININIYEMSSINIDKSGGKIGLDFKIANISANGGTERQITYKPNTVSPSFVAQKLSNKDGVLFIDEFDSLSLIVKEKVGEVIKLLSDNQSPFKLLVVGIGNSIVDLLAGNASITRNVRQIKLNRMTSSEISEIIINGSKKINLTYEPDVIKKIVEISAGYPHFAHLLALKSGEICIKKDQNKVIMDFLIESISSAVDDSEEYLTYSWNSTMQGVSSELYMQILIACSSITSNEIRAKELRQQLKLMFNINTEQNILNQYLKRLVADDESHILHRIAKGVYRFSDPRMPSFVKIQAINKNKTKTI